MEWKQEYRLANLFTLLNLVCGFLAIIFVKNAVLAAALMLFSVLFDFLDGRVARGGKPSSFGKQLDSLSDVVSFGVAPAVFGYVLIPSTWYTLPILAVFVACGALRLARFNVTEIKGFEGVPITTNGIIVPLLYFAGLPSVYLFWWYPLSAVLMVSKLRVKKL